MSIVVRRADGAGVKHTALAPGRTKIYLATFAPPLKLGYVPAPSAPSVTTFVPTVAVDPELLTQTTDGLIAKYDFESDSDPPPDPPWDEVLDGNPTFSDGFKIESGKMLGHNRLSTPIPTLMQNSDVDVDTVFVQTLARWDGIFASAQDFRPLMLRYAFASDGWTDRNLSPRPHSLRLRPQDHDDFSPVGST